METLKKSIRRAGNSADAGDELGLSDADIPAPFLDSTTEKPRLNNRVSGLVPMSSLDADWWAQFQNRIQSEGTNRE